MIIQRKQIIDELVKIPLIATPAKAGVQSNGWIPGSHRELWIPAFARMTGNRFLPLMSPSILIHFEYGFSPRPQRSLR
jgi:hypothetical protein